MIETKQKISNRFQVEFIKKLIEILSIGINDLPKELLFKILDYLPFKSVVKLSQTNHFWHRICDEDRIWKKLFEQNFETDAFNKALMYSDSWKQSFIKEFNDRIPRPIPRPIPIPRIIPIRIPIKSRVVDD
jgi:hypothetical protein